MRTTKFKHECDECGEEEYLTPLSFDPDLLVCKECFDLYKECGDCGDKYHEEGMEKDINERMVCMTCIKEAYKECASCEKYTDDFMSDDNNMPFCESCRNEGQGHWEEHYKDVKGDMEYDQYYR